MSSPVQGRGRVVDARRQAGSEGPLFPLVSPPASGHDRQVSFSSLPNTPSSTDEDP